VTELVAGRVVGADEVPGIITGALGEAMLLESFCNAGPNAREDDGLLR
jgi:hypothetical protein